MDMGRACVYDCRSRGFDPASPLFSFSFISFGPKLTQVVHLAIKRSRVVAGRMAQVRHATRRTVKGFNSVLVKFFFRNLSKNTTK